MNDSGRITSGLDAKSQQNLEKVVRNAERTSALVGFPNSGKTAYLTAMGKVLEGPQSNKLWRIVGSSEDIYMHVNELLRYEGELEHFEKRQFKTEEEMAEWRATEVHLAPKPLNLFNARRRGLLYRKTSAFDTSGEQYLAITQAPQDSSTLTPTEFYAEVLREKVLPKCPGMLVLVDCDLPPAKLSEQVNRYHVLFNRVHGFGFGEKQQQQSMRKLYRQRPFNQPIPIAFAITKVDLLEGRQITLRPGDCEFLKYLKQKKLDPANYGIRISNNGNIATYEIRTEIFLDQKRFDKHAAAALLQDFIQCHMSDLANLIYNMQMSDMYEVKTFAVSAWGKPLQRSEDGVEVRPSTKEIEPARVLEPQFWLLEKIHCNWRHHMLTKTFGWLCTILILLLLLGPGLFWGTMWLASHNLDRYQQDNFHNGSSLNTAYYSLMVNNNHPFTRFVQPYWERQAQQQLVNLNDEAIHALLERNNEGDKKRAVNLIDQSAKLGIPIPDIDAYYAEVLKQDFIDAMANDDIERIYIAGSSSDEDSITKAWLTVQARRRPRKYFNETIAILAEPLAWQQFAQHDKIMPARMAFLDAIDSFSNRQIDLSAASALPSAPPSLDTAAHNAYYYNVAHYFLQQGLDMLQESSSRQGQGSDYSIGNDPRVVALAHAREVLDIADEAARLSGNMDLMQQCYSANWQVNYQLFQIYAEEAITRNAENYQFDMLHENWYQVLRIFQQCPGLKRQLDRAAHQLIETLTSTASVSIRLLGDNCQDEAQRAIDAIDEAISVHSMLDYTYEVAQLQSLAAIYRFELIGCMNQRSQAGRIRQVLEQAKSLWHTAELTLQESPRGREIYSRHYRELSNIAVRLYETGKVSLYDLDPPIEMRSLVIMTIDNLINQEEYDGETGAIAQLNEELARMPAAEQEDGLAFRSHFLHLLQAVADSFGQPGLDGDLAQQRLMGLRQAAMELEDENLSALVDQLSRHLAVIDDMVLVANSEHNFYIDPTEVTVSAYHEFLAMPAGQEHVPYYNVLQPNGSYMAVRFGQQNFGDYSAADNGNSPIVGVGYEDAVAFADYQHKRLPTIREYQLLAGKLGGDLSRFAGDSENSADNAAVPLANVNMRRTGITPVDRPFQDEFDGVVGIAGNVREWTAYSGQRYAIFGMSYFRRGAQDWYENPYYCQADNRDRDTGFRCASDALPMGFAVPPAELIPVTNTAQ